MAAETSPARESGCIATGAASIHTAADAPPHAQLPPLRADIDMERYEALADVNIRGVNKEHVVYALEVAKRLWCQGAHYCNYSDRDAVRTGLDPVCWTR